MAVSAAEENAEKNIRNITPIIKNVALKIKVL